MTYWLFRTIETASKYNFIPSPGSCFSNTYPNIRLGPYIGSIIIYIHSRFHQVPTTFNRLKEDNHMAGRSGSYFRTWNWQLCNTPCIVYSVVDVDLGSQVRKIKWNLYSV